MLSNCSNFTVAVVGAGLAGCECAFFLAEQGIAVTLFEMKPLRFSPAHQDANLAELVCSNSLRSDDKTSAIGLLKQELRELGSVCLQAAEITKLPAGKALAVDRSLFSQEITRRIAEHENITLVRQEIGNLDDPTLRGYDKIVVAAGPLASDALSQSLARLTGADKLYFYDAIAPIIDAESVDTSIAFWGTRHDPEANDYLNCPLNEEEYTCFHSALLAAEKVASHDFEKEVHFEGCMPIESLAERGFQTLAFGPFKPVGFIDPRTGKRPFALVQLRAENHNKSMFNLVGCQTKLTYAAQETIFRLIPGLEHAVFVRHGSMHRNTFVNAPQVLADDLSLRAHPHIHLAGQITGVEGYVESAACGLWLGHVLLGQCQKRVLPLPPEDSCLGALLAHLRRPVKQFQPSNVQFGLMPELGQRAKKAQRRVLYMERARAAFAQWQVTLGA